MPIKIIQGSASSFIVQINNIKTGNPLSLAGVTALSSCFMKTDGTDLTLSLGSGLTILSEPLGQITVALTSAQTALIATTMTGVFQISIIFGSSDPIILQYPEAYQVVQSVC